MEKCMAAMHQRNLFRSNRVHTFSSVSSTGSGSLEAWSEDANLGAAQSSAEGKPTFSGESFMVTSARKPVTTAMMPGPSMPARQLNLAARPPARSGMRKPPMLWDAFQLLHHLPRLRAGNQLTSILLHGVAPHPWKRPFSTQIRVKSGTVLAVEKAMFRMPVRISPKEKMRTGDPNKSDKTPDKNLEFMYAKGNKELIVPNWTMLRPRSRRMARPT
mmetsp:Transcript_19924/g.37481  ORF Transcript_19924/g.37481 Transcript_19924/m.37481 type:complete len:216 (+) Transcript_19924:655-1302(+)